VLAKDILTTVGLLSRSFVVLHRSTHPTAPRFRRLGMTRNGEPRTEN
jgi:hypothetical protein